jgi:prepilin-type N-terminal cleavage/methylation domain-containing protein
MRSTDRRRGQRGVSLIESVVASALMGIGVVGGLTAWDTASVGANRAVRIAWGNCIVRSELDGILSEQYASSYAVPSAFAGDGTLVVTVSPVRNGAEQVVTVKAYDPADPTHVLAQASTLKAEALAGDESADNPLGDVAQGCPRR